MGRPKKQGVLRNIRGHIVCEHGRYRQQCGQCRGPNVIRQYRRRATIRGYTFELTPSRFNWLLSQSCVYCGDPAGGVDRVKNDYGYTTMNAVPCCGVCNIGKRTLSAPDFIAHAHKIVAHSSTYEEFKTRWVETRTTGPDLEVSSGSTQNNNLAHASQPEVESAFTD